MPTHNKGGASGDRTLQQTQRNANLIAARADLKAYLEKDVQSMSEKRRLLLEAGKWLPQATATEIQQICDYTKAGIVIPKHLRLAKLDKETDAPLGAPGAALAATPAQLEKVAQSKLEFDAWRESEAGTTFLTKLVKFLTRKSHSPKFKDFSLKMKRDGKRNVVESSFTMVSNVANTAATKKAIGANRSELAIEAS